MALFLSSFVNKIDKKGRISVPAQFRAVIAASGNSYNFSGIVVYPSFINPCIEACTLDRMEKISESIDNLDPYSEKRDAFATTILGGAVQLAFDGEGRVMLPEDLLKSSGIKENAIFVGKGATFEIWNPKNFDEYYKKSRDIAKKDRSALTLTARKGKEG